MVKIIAILIVSASLCACESQAEQDAQFVGRCEKDGGFTADQCRFLNAMANKSEDDAASAMAVGAAGMSMSAIRR